MSLIYDTNICLLIIRDKTLEQKVRSKVNPNLNAEFISWVTSVELQAIAYRQKWGTPKISKLQKFLEQLNIVDIQQEQLVERYIEIDAFSQGKHPEKFLGGSAKNMGKHDIWIAATSSLLSFQLVSTDKDFDHLQIHFINLNRFLPSELFY